MDFVLIRMSVIFFSNMYSSSSLRNTLSSFFLVLVAIENLSFVNAAIGRASMNPHAVSGTYLALHKRSKTKGPGDIPCKQNQSCFSGKENGLIFGLCGNAGSACCFSAYPRGDMRVLAAIGRPLRTHNAVSGVILLPFPWLMKNKKTAISPSQGK